MLLSALSSKHGVICGICHSCSIKPSSSGSLIKLWIIRMLYCKQQPMLPHQRSAELFMGTNLTLMGKDGRDGEESSPSKDLQPHSWRRTFLSASVSLEVNVDGRIWLDISW